MSRIIESGAGAAYKWKIDEKNRGLTFSVTQDELISKLKDGDSYYVSLGAIDFYGGTYTSTEYVIGELYNNSTKNYLIVGAEFWCAPAYTTGPYAETTDQYFRLNQWLYEGSKLSGVGTSSIVKNLNRTSTNTLDVRSDGTLAMLNATRTTAIATPGSSDPGYICGFYASHGQGKFNLIPENSGMIIGRGQSWILSYKPIQNSTPTNQFMGARMNVIVYE